MSTSTTSILIVDDNEFMRWAIRDLLQKHRPAWVVCGEAANGKDAISAAKNLKPDVVILDESMPGMTGVEAAKRLAKLRLKTRVLLLSAYEQKDMAIAAESVGLRKYGYVDKATAGRDLVPAVEDLIGVYKVPDAT